MLTYANVCGANAEFICNNLKIDGFAVGKIIITEWVGGNKDVKNTIQTIYGPIGNTIGACYHALAYLKTTIGTKYYIAIETTICTPYKLQFYIANDLNKFGNIITTRYQCTDFRISFDCDKLWNEIAYGRGGRKRTKKGKKKQITGQEKKKQTGKGALTDKKHPKKSNKTQK
jgi:hypothetical protein